VRRGRRTRRHGDVGRQPPLTPVLAAHPAVALIGDSHAEQLFIGFAGALSRENVVYYLVNGAPVTTDAHFARIVKYVAASRSIKTFVVSAYWYSRGVHGRQLLTTLET
jgi:hypothetical protein